MKDYDFLQPAQIELEEEVKYYNEQRVGLGYELAMEVADTINRILNYPEAWTKFSKRTRRCGNSATSSHIERRIAAR